MCPTNNDNAVGMPCTDVDDSDSDDDGEQQYVSYVSYLIPGANLSPMPKGLLSCMLGPAKRASAREPSETSHCRIVPSAPPATCDRNVHVSRVIMAGPMHNQIIR